MTCLLNCKGVSTICRAAECNILQLCQLAKVARHTLLMRSRLHEKRILQTFFSLQKLWNETSELCLIFFSNWLIPFWNPLLIICRTASCNGTNNLPIEFSGRAASNGMTQMFTYTCSMVWLLLRDLSMLCVTQHSVDVP